MESTPSDSIGTIAAMARCFGAVTRRFLSMRMSIWLGWSATFTSTPWRRESLKCHRTIDGRATSIIFGPTEYRVGSIPQRLWNRLGRKAFHEFVLSGNVESLKQYYERQRQIPILGSEEFMERVRQPLVAAAKEHARYERRVLELGPERVISEVVRQYKVTREEIIGGKGVERMKRGK